MVSDWGMPQFAIDSRWLQQLGLPKALARGGNSNAQLALGSLLFVYSLLSC